MPRDWPALYSLQDRALACLRLAQQGFYLTGGTALSRGYYGHRYSEDLDFFANDVSEFELWRDRCLDTLQRAGPAEGWHLEIVLRESRFGRAVLHGAIALKLEFVNDVPFRVGLPWDHPALGRLDSKENILANKVSALVDREEPKDLADLYWLCCRDRLDLRVTGPGGAPVYYPYRLNANSPNDAATTGDNRVDNVEQVRLAAPVAGAYSLTISHKQTLSSGQHTTP